MGVGGGGTGVLVGRISMTSVPIGVASPSGVTDVAVGVFLGAEVVAAELQATIRHNNITNCNHNPFFILTSPSKLERCNYNLNLSISQAKLFHIS